MTKEDVSEALKGDAVQGWNSSYQRPVIHQVASAPMPSDCRECSQTQYTAHCEAEWNFGLINIFTNTGQILKSFNINSTLTST